MKEYAKKVLVAKNTQVEAVCCMDKYYHTLILYTKDCYTTKVRLTIFRWPAPVADMVVTAHASASRPSLDDCRNGRFGPIMGRTCLGPNHPTPSRALVSTIYIWKHCQNLL